MLKFLLSYLSYHCSHPHALSRPENTTTNQGSKSNPQSCKSKTATEDGWMALCYTAGETCSSRVHACGYNTHLHSNRRLSQYGRLEWHADDLLLPHISLQEGFPVGLFHRWQLLRRLQLSRTDPQLDRTVPPEWYLSFQSFRFSICTTHSDT